MKSIQLSRHERHKKIVLLLPPADAASAFGRDAPWLLEQLSQEYGNSDRRARLRALQRDLQSLVEEERIEVVNPGCKPLRYRRHREDPTEDSLWRYTKEHVAALAQDVMPRRQVDQLWQLLRGDNDAPFLDATRLRIVSDNLRLQPPVICPESLAAVITALAEGYVLDVIYVNAKGERKPARIHPQAIVQRGPIPYLFALKNDEDEPVRQYALHRMVSAQVLDGIAARQAPSFDLDNAIAKGLVDFGTGDRAVTLELRVRGYLVELLQDCPLSADQMVEDEPEETGFRLRIKATLPSTGQLLRWLLGGGPNLEVLAPLELRHVVAVQTTKMAGLYAEDERPL
mgnify:CR=1 FL=1